MTSQIKQTFAQRQFTELPPLSLYVHLPWCVRKCPYCDFNSHEARGEIPETAYVDALLADLEQEMPDIWGRSLSSVFIGGGTPSLFSAEAIDRLLSGLRALIGLPPTIEITMEANPGTFEQARFSAYRQIGINRLSIGVQSFDNEQLQRLGRIHNGDEARRALAIAREAGFDNINLDLMFGLPEQSLKAATQDLAQAIEGEPTHISLYELTLEPNTLFHRFPPTLPDDDLRWEMQEAAIAQLADAGYARYEVSAYARAGHRSVHNLNYWLFGDYVGIGAGAHSKLSFADSGRIIRRWKQRHPATYLKQAHTADRVGEQITISHEDTALEFMMNALRLVDGFPIPLFQTHTGLPLQHWQAAVDQAMQAGLLEQQAMALRPTARGLDLLNDVLEPFMHDPTVRHYPVIPLIPD